MPQGTNASPSLFVKVISKVMHMARSGCWCTWMMSSVSTKTRFHTYVLNMIEFFKRQHRYNLKLFFLGHTISPAGMSPDGDKVRALTGMPSPAIVTQLRGLLGGLSYYRKFLKNLTTKERPLNAALSTSSTTQRSNGRHGQINTQRPVLLFPDWGAVAENSRPLRFCFDSCTDGFRVSLEQEQLDVALFVLSSTPAALLFLASATGLF